MSISDPELFRGYLRYCETYKVDPENMLSYDEFKKDSIAIEKLQLAFAPGSDAIDLGESIILGLGGAATIASNVKSSLRKAGDIRKAFMSAKNDAFKEANRIKDTLNRNKERSASGGSNVENGPINSSNFGGGDFNFEVYSSNRNIDLYRSLTLKVKPVEVEFKTNIPNRSYVIDANRPGLWNSTMNLTFARLDFPFDDDYSSSPDNQYFFLNVLCDEIRRKLMMNVRFKIKTEDLSPNILGNYFRALSYALQVFYFYASIFEYNDRGGLGYQNQAFLALENGMDAEEVRKLLYLKRKLALMPIPPNLNAACFFLMNNFKENSLANSTIIKLCPFSWKDNDNSYYPSLESSGVIDGILSAFTQATPLIDLLAKALPSWCEQELFAPTPQPIYSQQFETIFKNLPLAGKLNAPTSETIDTPIIYNSFSDSVDGFVMSLTTVLVNIDKDTQKWMPSLIRPVPCKMKSGDTNRLSYTSYKDTGDAFYPRYTDEDLAHVADETYVSCYNNTVVSKFKRYGCIETRKVVPSMVIDTVNEAMEFLLSIDQMPITNQYLPKKEPSKPNNRDKRSRNRNRDKPKPPSAKPPLPKNEEVKEE